MKKKPDKPEPQGRTEQVVCIFAHCQVWGSQERVSQLPGGVSSMPDRSGRGTTTWAAREYTMGPKKNQASVTM